MRILLANFTKMVQDSGGLAKVNCAFANAMVERGHEVATVYSDDREGEFFFQLTRACSGTTCGISAGKASFFRRR